jgi:hypothetical protein
MKLKLQAQYLQPGDIVGSGEVVERIIVNSIHWPSSKIMVELTGKKDRACYWGKYAMINVERPNAAS